MYFDPSSFLTQKKKIISFEQNIKIPFFTSNSSSDVDSLFLSSCMSCQEFHRLFPIKYQRKLRISGKSCEMSMRKQFTLFVFLLYILIEKTILTVLVTLEEIFYYQIAKQKILSKFYYTLLCCRLKKIRKMFDKNP